MGDVAALYLPDEDNPVRGLQGRADLDVAVGHGSDGWYADGSLNVDGFHFPDVAHDLDLRARVQGPLARPRVVGERERGPDARTRLVVEHLDEAAERLAAPLLQVRGVGRALGEDGQRPGSVAQLDPPRDAVLARALRAHERELVGLYRDTLLAEGVAAAPLDDLSAIWTNEFAELGSAAVGG